MAMQDTLRALADPTRREILTLLRAGPLTAGQIAERFPVSAAAVSRHLSVLKEADLVRDRREGKYIYYELNASVLEEILLWLTTLKGEENDETLE
ncbi:MAG TPA: autorepressor SdpR family transcription factor [Candidatus Fournierella excrementavium]|uniref:autorepressor SdpR family transcription factor n=1 Tax=Allofournierella TaxID=1940255 RepID=UPI0015AB94A7|nr:autorepressor SdpR family transcription factor [Fournierella sp.]MCI6958664.1 autorepressor SdpR family transcription factor [Oscillospiraceae bacterium]MEE0756773.1 autorepressor SdpR family transcription factor [Fournierella sp.]HJD17957.1 autorepressor SdpR family transcription factor [Candidatus Fournierella excrementavium]